MISDLEDKIMEITTAEHNKEKRMKRIEDSLRDIWDNIKRTNIHIIGVPEGEERNKWAENIFKAIIAEDFLNLERKQISKSREYREFHTGSIKRGSHKDTL